MTSKRKPVAENRRSPVRDIEGRRHLEAHFLRISSELAYWEALYFLGLSMNSELQPLHSRWDRHQEMNRTVESHAYDD